MRRSGSIFVALALIGIGVLLLLRDAGVIQRDARLWPLLVMVFGAAMLVDRLAEGGAAQGGFAWPLVLIAAGGLFLLQDLRVVERDLSVWPVVLIALGVGIVLSGLPIGRRKGGRLQVETIPLDGAASARIAVEHQAGRLTLSGSHEPSALLEGTFVGGVAKQVRRQADRLEVRLSPHGVGGTLAPWVWGRGRALDWTVAVSRRVPLVLELDLGASRAELDLSDVRATDLLIQAGASDVDLRLPTGGDTVCRIKAGAAKLRVRVPDRVAARIVLQGAASSLRVDEVRFRRRDGRYESPDYEHASQRVDLELDVGTADVEVR